MQPTNETALMRAPSGALTIEVEQQRFMPALTLDLAVQRRNIIVQATQRLMKDGVDYGKIPGSEKPSLLQPGADKLCNLFGLSIRYVTEVEIEDWSGKQHGEAFFYYRYRAQAYRGDYLMGESVGSCSSWESKYRYRWVAEDQLPPGADKSRLQTKAGKITEFDFAINKAETAGKYGKPASYWQTFREAIEQGRAVKHKKRTGTGKEMDVWSIESVVYRLPNPDICDQVNTIQKMAQKRAKVGATINATSASEFFTQDADDVGGNGEPPAGPPPTEAPLPHETPPVEIHPGTGPREQAKGPEDFKAMLKQFADLKEHFQKFGLGDVYYKVLGANGYEHSNQIPNLKAGRDLYKLLKLAFADATKPSDAAEAEMQQ